MIFAFCSGACFLQAHTLSFDEQDEQTSFDINRLEAIAFSYVQADTLLMPSHGKDPIVAWLINFPGGMLGLHRWYLGAKPRVMIWYIVSIGGFFGIVPMVDWILLLQGIQKGDISPYVNNSKFLMWL